MSTTVLSEIRKSPKQFTWGPVESFIDIGDDYTIVRYTVSGDGHMFHVYVKGKDTALGATSLEGAIILAIGYNKLGLSEGPAMARAACRVLNIRVSGDPLR